MFRAYAVLEASLFHAMPLSPVNSDLKIYRDLLSLSICSSSRGRNLPSYGTDFSSIETKLRTERAGRLSSVTTSLNGPE